MKKKIEIKNEIKSIAIIRTDRIGEVLLATPVIKVLRENMRYLKKITFVTSPYAREIVSDRADINEVITFDTIGLKKISLWRIIGLGLKLFSKRCNAVIVLNPHKALHLAAFLSGARYRIGYNRKWGALLTHKVEDNRHEGRMHEIEYNLELLKVIGIDSDGIDISPFIPVLSSSTFYVKGLLEQVGITGKKKLIVVHPGSSNPAKIWPIDNFRSVIKKVSENTDFDIVVIGARGERMLCEKIASGFGDRVVSLAGLFTVKTLAALIKMADLMITNDNGPMHIASALGVKVIAIFSRNFPAASPRRWGPYGENHIVFHKDPGCSPCPDKGCIYDFKCLKSITPDEVYEAAKRVLA